MNRYLFEYQSNYQNLMVTIEAKTLNEALIKFATNYHDIQKVDKITKNLPVFS